MGAREKEIADLITDMDAGYAEEVLGILDEYGESVDFKAEVNGDVLLGYAYELCSECEPEIVERMVALGADPGYACIDADGDVIVAVRERCQVVLDDNGARDPPRLPRHIHPTVLTALGVTIPASLEDAYADATAAATAAASPGVDARDTSEDDGDDDAPYNGRGVEPRVMGVNMVMCDKCGSEYNVCLPPDVHEQVCGGPQGMLM